MKVFVDTRALIFLAKSEVRDLEDTKYGTVLIIMLNKTKEENSKGYSANWLYIFDLGLVISLVRGTDLLKLSVT